VQGQERRQSPTLHSIPVGDLLAVVGIRTLKKWMRVLIRIAMPYLTKWPEVYAVADWTATTVAKCLADLIYRHGLGVPTSLIHDHAPECLQDTAFVLDIKQFPTTPVHPLSDGLIKRFNRTLKFMLAKLITNKGRDWDKLLGPVLFAYRTMIHSSTGNIFFCTIW